MKRGYRLDTSEVTSWVLRRPGGAVSDTIPGTHRGVHTDDEHAVQLHPAARSRTFGGSCRPSGVLVPCFHVDLADYPAVFYVDYRMLEHALPVRQGHVDAEGGALTSQDLVGERDLDVALL